jgi:8-oxo-dGTP pyrophosphatase MutT (NUDIX family)
MSQPSSPKPAATLVLLRPEATGFSVLLMQRPSRSSFMAGMHVFPGGKLEATDVPAAPTPGHAALAARMGLAAAESAAFATAAGRETFEEMGLLLAEHALAAAELREARRALAAGELAWADWAPARAAQPLVYFDHWVTPAVEPKRFDTRFFAAALPAGAAPEPNEESIAWGFYAPAAALAKIEAGDMAMAPPTLVTMMRLAKYHTIEEALAGLAARAVAPLQPEFAGAEPLTLALPGHEKHPVRERLADNPLAIELSLEGKWKIYW